MAQKPTHAAGAAQTPAVSVVSPPAARGLRANKSTSIGRQHVETEESLNSVVEFPSTPFALEGFITGDHGKTQVLSADEATGASTQRVMLRKGWTAPIGHFTTNVEVFVLSGCVRHSGFHLRKLTYAFVPAGVVTGPWIAEEDTVLLWMPDAQPSYVTDDYAQLEQIPENSVYHQKTQFHDRMPHYIPAQELHAMNWESTSFLPAGSARKSLYTDTETGRATWILGLVPMWIEGNFFAGHPTTEEAYLITGDVQGHWSMTDAPFDRRYAAMRTDGYYWRPAHVPHGPFWSESGALLLFRTDVRLDCYWLLHNPDVTQRDQDRLTAAQRNGKSK